jgi:anti-sigma factor RsiW
MMRLFRFDDPEHGKAAELLPWLVNDTLRGAERVRVERHLAECAACRSEMEDLRTLQASVAEDEANPEITLAFSRVNARLDSVRAGLSAKRILRWIAAEWMQSRPWLRAAVIGQSALLAVLIGALLAQPAPHYYRTLSTPPGRVSAGDHIVIVFNPSLREAEVRNMLLDLHARIVDGPSPAGAYTLELAPGEQPAALAKLRRQRSVVFAEPVP